MISDPELAQAKCRVREAALAARSRQTHDASEQLAAVVLRDCPPPEGAIVAGFWPLNGEINLRPLMTILAERGHRLALPETGKRGNPLIFRLWQPGDALVPGPFGTFHPTSEIVIPDFILTPLLAFDRSGNRLGYGAGYYDRTLASLPHALRLGCAFAAQEVPRVPAGPHDQRLHAIATEQSLIRAVDRVENLG